VSVIWRKPVLTYAVSVVSLTASVNSVKKFWTLRFEPPLGRGLGTTYDVHLGLIRKRVVDFLLVLIELFSLGDYG